jgi:putative ABC transport system permease protein
MEISIHKSIDSLGSNVLYIQKWPWAMGGDYPWWKYYQRPEATLGDMHEIQARSNLSDATAFFVQVNKTVKFRNNYVNNVGVMGVSQEFDKVWKFEVTDGRYFSPTEFNSGKNVAIIGADIASNLIWRS